ncbi:MAG: PrsW family glutamic-type intramembrane protease [Micropepsaceae bacterium]
MTLNSIMAVPLALVPTLAFLILLDQLDSFKLVSFRALVRALTAGAALAVMAFFVNSALIDALFKDYGYYSRYGAPIIEELFKASYVVMLFRQRRVGFLIDAAVLGFAAGAGFSFAENLYFLWSLSDVSMGVWIVRGFGTAMMHGGATAIFAVLSQSLTERHTQGSGMYYVPGLVAALVIHAGFNQLISTPLVATGMILLFTPAALFLVFAKSEHGVHDYLKAGHDLHARVLQSLDEGFLATPEGKLVADIVGKFSGDHLTGVIDYIRLHTELVMQAEEIFLSRETHTKIPMSHDVRQKFSRLHALEKEIGRTALLALWPHLKFSRREMAELYEFEELSRSPLAK